MKNFLATVGLVGALAFLAVPAMAHGHGGGHGGHSGGHWGGGHGGHHHGHGRYGGGWWPDIYITPPNPYCSPWDRWCNNPYGPWGPRPWRRW